MQSEVLKELLGKEVQIWSTNGDVSFRDEGILEAFDGVVLKVVKNGETLYFPLYNVRLIKLAN